MDTLSREYLVDFYSRNLSLLGDTPQAVRWSPDGQRLRYSLMLEGLPPLDGMSALDYGCGKADLLGYLKERGIDCRYTGVDINPDLIALARSKYPETEFHVADIEEINFHESFDVVFVCGVFNNRVDGVSESMINSLHNLFDITRVALAFNGLSTDAPAMDFELHYIDKDRFIEYVLSGITPHMAICDDYLKGDFMTFMYKNAKAMTWKSSA